MFFSHRGNYWNKYYKNYFPFLMIKRTKAQRIRAAIFPETLEGSGNKQIQLSTRIGKPKRCPATNSSIANAKNNHFGPDKICWRRDRCSEKKAIPEILKLLQGGKSVVAKSVAFVDQLSREDASRTALGNSQNYKGTIVLKYSFIIILI